MNQVEKEIQKADINFLPWELPFKGSRTFLFCYDYFDEDANEICYCVEYRNNNGHPKIWAHSLLKQEAVNKMADKLREMGFNIACLSHKD